MGTNASRGKERRSLTHLQVSQIISIRSSIPIGCDIQVTVFSITFQITKSTQCVSDSESAIRNNDHKYMPNKTMNNE
jgi:hypothetical protein